MIVIFLNYILNFIIYTKLVRELIRYVGEENDKKVQKRGHIMYNFRIVN